MYHTEFEKADNQEQLKQQNAIKILERRKFFSRIINENFIPKVDPVKEEEFRKLREREVTKPREGLDKEDLVREGNEFLRRGNLNTKSERTVKTGGVIPDYSI